MRYEDILPDGRVSTTAMPQALGVGFWQTIAPRFGIGEGRRRTGVVPILSRMATCGGEGPVGLLAPVRIDARFRLARVEQDGETRRILLEVWADLFAPRGKVHGDPPAGAGEELMVGRVYAEHVFTRPFAPPGERRVTQLPDGSLTELAQPVVSWPGPDAIGELPADVEALDAAWTPDEAAIVFGLDHGDSNQHVNSLVYPQLFRDAALRHLARHRGEGVAEGVFEGALAVHGQDTTFRKPCFPGERMRVLLRAYRRVEGAVGVAARLVPEEDRGRRGHAFARVELGS